MYFLLFGKKKWIFNQFRNEIDSKCGCNKCRDSKSSLFSWKVKQVKILKNLCDREHFSAIFNNFLSKEVLLYIQEPVLPIEGYFYFKEVECEKRNERGSYLCEQSLTILIIVNRWFACYLGWLFELYWNILITNIL